MKTGESVELMQLFGHSDTLSFLRMSWLNWIGHVNSTRKVSQVLKVILREVDYEDGQKTDCGIVYKQKLINAKLKTG